MDFNIILLKPQVEGESYPMCL